MHPTHFRFYVKMLDSKAMSMELSALDHVCNVIRREIQDELKDLTIYFVAFETGACEKALKGKHAELLDHPAGEILMPYLKKISQGNENKSLFACAGSAEQKLILPIFKKQKTLAVCFVHAGDFESQDHARQHIYHLTWHALSLLEHHKLEESDFYQEKNGVIRPHNTPINLARKNMLADVFSVALMELMGQKGQIEALARKRSLMSLQAIPRYKAEDYPYAMATEATGIVYDEFVDLPTPKVFTRACEITREIDLTYDDNSIKQWRDFALAAQELAWLGADTSKILGLAIYTSEDPYVRSMAYLVAETLEFDPAVLSNLTEYNPFTDQEANERHHLKDCEKAFNGILSKLNEEEDGKLFIERANTQNQKLFEGHILGWCAHAILAAKSAYEKTDPESDEDAKDNAKKAFSEALETLSWENIRPISRIIMGRRRAGKELTLEILTALCESDETLGPVASALKNSN